METLVEEETSATLTRRFIFNTCVRSLIRALSVSHIPSELHLWCRSMVSVWNHGDTNMLMFSVMPDEVVHTAQSMEAWEDEAVLQLWKLTKSAILSWSSLCFYLCLCTNQIVLLPVIQRTRLIVHLCPSDIPVWSHDLCGALGYKPFVLGSKHTHLGLQTDNCQKQLNSRGRKEKIKQTCSVWNKMYSRQEITNVQ